MPSASPLVTDGVTFRKMSKALLDQVAKNRKNIKHEVVTYGLSELVNMQRAGDIRIQPEYQRLFRWSREQQSLFIESLVLEIPVPPLFFYENDDGKWELLDGLQRLSTIIKFMGVDEDVPTESRGPSCNDEEWHEQTQNDITKPLQLLAGDYLTEIDGVSFARLPTPLQLNLKRGRLQLYVLKRETDASYKYEVFKRLNTTGAKLEDQEVRNCGARILGDAFPDFLQKLGKRPSFTEVLGLDEAELRAGKADELVLRYLSMKNWHHQFKHDVREHLTKYMEEVASGKLPFDYNSEESVFNETCDLLVAAFPNERIFHPKKGGTFSPTVFEIVVLSVALNVPTARSLKPEDLRTRLEEVIAAAKEQGLTGAGSNSKKKTLGRVEKAKAWLSL